MARIGFRCLSFVVWHGNLNRLLTWGLGQFGPLDADACHSTVWITGCKGFMLHVHRLPIDGDNTFVDSYDILTWIAEALVGVHVWAVWGRDRRLTFAMPVAFTALFTASLITMVAALKDFMCGSFHSQSFLFLLILSSHRPAYSCWGLLSGQRAHQILQNDHPRHDLDFLCVAHGVFSCWYLHV